MSTLNVSNITDGTTTVSTGYVVNGSAKAWVNFNGTGTIAARDSFNVASLTDNGTGDYLVNFSNSLSDANYSAVGTTVQEASSTALIVCIGSLASSNAEMQTGRSNSAVYTRVDASTACVNFCGSLA